MEKASKVMYSIANFFVWIVVLLMVAGIVFCVLGALNVFQINPEQPLGWGHMVPFIIVLVIALITIAMVRRAKASDSSKAWDFLFMILGIFGGNIFYFLGGLFGLIARR